MSLDAQDLTYIAKLRQSGRDVRLISAYILVLLAIRRLQADALKHRIQIELAGSVTVLGGAVAAYVAKQMRSEPEPTRQVAIPLLAAITLHAYKAQKLAPGEREARLGLIVRAELQNATAEASRHAAESLNQTVDRQTNSPNPCPECIDLSGIYSPPYPDELWWDHPSCACSWAVEGEEP